MMAADRPREFEDRAKAYMDVGQGAPEQKRSRLRCWSRVLLVGVLVTPMALLACSGREEERQGVVGQGDGQGEGAAAAVLTDTYWKLVEIGGEPAGLGAGDREVHVIFGAGDGSVRGFSGCNRFQGSVEIEENTIRMGPVASTRMACAKGGDLEMRFLNALGAMDRYEISEGGLRAYSGDLRSMSFEAGDLPVEGPRRE